MILLVSSRVSAWTPACRLPYTSITTTTTTTMQQQQKSTVLSMGTPGMDMSGNTWKPDSEKMGSTDTGDYFPEGYNPDEEIAFSR
jgi:hypothetical protein